LQFVVITDSEKGKALGLGPIASKDAKHVFVYIARQLLAGRRIRDGEIRALVCPSAEEDRLNSTAMRPSATCISMGHLASIRRVNFQGAQKVARRRNLLL
jgi:hypothetical protein